MEIEQVKKLTDKIRIRIKKEAKDLECLKILTQKNPELAKLCADIDDIIDSWAFSLLREKEIEMAGAKNQS